MFVNFCHVLRFLTCFLIFIWTFFTSRAATTHQNVTSLTDYCYCCCYCYWVGRHDAKTSLDLNDARDDGVWGRQWHQLDHMQTICTSLQTDNHTTPHHSIFYRPDALLLDAQPTVSKHFRQVCFTGGWKDYTLFILFAFQVNFVVLM